MEIGKTLLTRIRNKSEVSNLIVELLYLKEEITMRDAEYLFEVALMLINEFQKEGNQNKHLLIEFAYLIIAKTCFKIHDFRALYDFSVNFGYYPIARKILSAGLLNSCVTIQHLIIDNNLENFTDGYKVKTFEQNKIFKKVLNSDSKQLLFNAPTSYGKSELIFNHLNRHHDKNKVAIIVPTKALIDQTYREERKNVLNRKIIIHDQNYDYENDKVVLVIVTQERALRLIDEGLKFDLIYIDEAHELLNFSFYSPLSNRSLLLSRVIKLSRKMNPLVQLVYLSPTIQDSNSLQLLGQEQIQDYRIKNDLKILDIKYLDKSGQEFIYDLFLNKFIHINKYVRHNSLNYIVQLTCERNFKKNLHYIFKPKKIEDYSEKLYNLLPESEIPRDIIELQKELSRVIHPKFKLIRFLGKGIVYLHGKLPLIIRNYLLKYIREHSFLNNFIANSVILAGMNLPIDNLIYISGFNGLSDLKNLIGRVNRLNEIFASESNLSKIFIPIHFIDMEDYPQFNKTPLENKIVLLRGNHKDEIKNPLLEKYNGNNDKAQEIREYEEEIITKYENPDFITRLSTAGAQQILNYSNRGLIELEKIIEGTEKIEGFENLIEKILLKIREVFFASPFVNDLYFINEEYFKPLNNAKRLRYKETCEYYKNFLELSYSPFPDRVDNLVKFWESVLGNAKSEQNSYFVYVGSQFGEVPYVTESYSGIQKVYIDLRSHRGETDFLYNVAILKLQIDEDFISYEITLLLNTLKEFEIISEEQFNYFLYGTLDKSELNILKLGISKNMYKILKNDDQIINIEFDTYGNARANEKLLQYIKMKNGIEKFELEQLFE